MAQVKVYGLRSHLRAFRSALSDAIHESLVEVFELPASKRFQRFIGLEVEDFLFDSDRSDRYTIIEISMFEGRSAETKKRLIRTLFSRLEQRTGLTPQDLEITMFETPRGNWGIRGQTGDELTLNYKVEV
jgi:phenylpyruvate tautomerase PptA (4-oxalocrotonate tautomerase family)